MVQKHFRVTLLIFLFIGIGTMFASAQEKVTGNIKDNTGAALPGVNIIIKGTTVGTLSDVNGNYTIQVKDINNDVLQFSMVGYKGQDIVVGGKKNIDIVMEEEIRKLEEVVVIGYGTIKKSDLTGAVASVKTEEITQLSTVDVQQAMVGRIAGVNVTTNSGEPGAGTKVRIRGTGTINNSDPLYVVDGFPTSDISYLNPSDIESMEILKDASATAIYGNRGANGVVLISTRKGKEQKTSVNFSMYTSMQEVAKTIPVCNAEEYAQARILAVRNKYVNDSIDAMAKGDAASMALLVPIDQTRDSLFRYIIANHFKGTDWQNELLRKGAAQNYSLSITGGNEKNKYDISGSYHKEEGIVINSKLEKYFLRFNNQYQFTKGIKGEVSINYVSSKKTNYNYGYFGGILPQALQLEPYMPVINPTTGDFAGTVINKMANPVANANRLKYNTNKFDKFVGNLSADATILEGLVFTSKFGADLTFNDNNNYLPQWNYSANDQQNMSNLQVRYQNTYALNSSNYFNYQKEIGLNSLNLMVGQEMGYYRSGRADVIAYDIPKDPALQYLENATGVQDPTVNLLNPSNKWDNFHFEQSMVSFFGRVNYTYNSKYMITASVRRDGSSKLAPKNRWGTFPSFSIGWNIKQESFLKDNNAISALKLRGGYGITGNESSVSDPYAGVVRYRYLPSSTGSSVIETPYNPDLKWEVTKAQNYGLDVAFINNKLTATVDYYIRKTEDMITKEPDQAGVEQPRFNFGAMENKGLEVSLGFRNLDNKFKYEVNGNISFLEHPKLTKLFKGPTAISTGSVYKWNDVIRHKAGEEFNTFYGYKTDGLITAADTALPMYKNRFHIGDMKVADVTGNDTLDENDKVILGSPNPDYTFGLNFNFMYMGFDLKVFIQGVQGNELVNGMTASIASPSEGSYNMYKYVLEGWQEGVRENSTIPRLIDASALYKDFFTDRIVEDASYVRIKNVQIGYTLPKSLTSKLKISNLRVYFSIDNLKTFTNYTGYDPEVGQFIANTTGQDPLQQGIDVANYPQSRTYTVGLNLNF